MNVHNVFDVVLTAGGLLSRGRGGQVSCRGPCLFLPFRLGKLALKPFIVPVTLYGVILFLFVCF